MGRRMGARRMFDIGALPLIHNYELCKHPVTIYHRTDDGVTRTVYEKAYLDFKKTENVERTGSSEVNTFLLVIPGDTVACEVGDKVFDGIGEEVTGDAAAWWRDFIPTKHQGVCVVKFVDIKRWNGVIVHTEAGG